MNDLNGIKNNFSLLLKALTMLKIKIEAIVNKKILVVKLINSHSSF